MSEQSSLPTLTRYHLNRRINAGGMGTVYVGTHKELGKQVAIKIPLASIVQRQDAMIRFKREGKILAALNHPNIVAVHDAGVDNGYPFLVMEYIEGENFESRLRRLGGEDIENVITLCSKLSDALSYMHTRDVIHRDIKSANIILDTSGTPILTDFGIAYSSDFTLENLTTDGFMGTLRYVAPELLSGGFPSALSDIYSFGVVLYECLVGQSPFDGLSAAAIMKQILEEDPEPIQHERPEVPEWLVNIVNRCLSKKPSDRYQKAGDILKDLKGGGGNIQKTIIFNEQISGKDTLADIEPVKEEFLETKYSHSNTDVYSGEKTLKEEVATEKDPIHFNKRKTKKRDSSNTKNTSLKKEQNRSESGKTNPLFSVPVLSFIAIFVITLAITGILWRNNRATPPVSPQTSEQIDRPESNNSHVIDSELLEPSIKELMFSNTLQELQPNLLAQREMGMLTFGTRSDFYSPESCYIVILSQEGTVQDWLIPHSNGGWSVYGKDNVVQNPEDTFKGMAAIWIQLQES